MTFFNRFTAAAVLRTACDLGNKRRGKGLGQRPPAPSPAGTAWLRPEQVSRWSDSEK